MRKIDLTNFRVASSKTARDINRRIVLDLIRTRQPVSRADLARQTGLQRSTISLITQQLIADRWVSDGAVAHAPRGRKPILLHLNVDRARILGINLRPITTTIGVADPNCRFTALESVATPSDPQEFLALLTKRLRALMKDQGQIFYEGIGVSLPGRVDDVTRRLVFAPNLGWRDLDLKTPLERATGLPVELENAANACALAEVWFGEHREGVRDLVAVTVSEGVGTGVIANGQLLRGPTGLAGEFGHIAINEDGPPCACGNRGCWERYASNSAAVEAYVQATGGSKNRRRAGRRVSKPSFEDILRRAEQGDVKAQEALDRMGHYLGVGFAMLITAFAPRLIVVVGEVTHAWDRVSPIISRAVAERCAIEAPRIVPAGDGGQGRLRGTIALVLQKHFGAPAVA